MISIVVTGKNDNYGGHFDERLELTLKYNIKKFKERGIDTEIVFVEWNPVPDHPLLSEKLVNMLKNVRCYVVEKEDHDLLSGPYTHMTFLEFFAKNVGIRRSMGEYIICTNADVFYGESVFDNIANEPLDKNTIYRTQRNDIRFLKLNGLSEKHFEVATFRVNPLYNRKPYTDASGDFTMASKELFEKLQGYDENQRFVKIHKDTRILFSSLYNREVDYKEIGKMYHIDHEGSAVGTTGRLDNYRPTNGPYQWKYTKNLPYENRDFWGMSSEIVDEIELKENIHKLTFKKDFNIDQYNFDDSSYMFSQDFSNRTKVVDLSQEDKQYLVDNHIFHSEAMQTKIEEQAKFRNNGAK